MCCGCPVPILYLTATEDAVVGGASVAAIRSIRDDVWVKAIIGPHMLLQSAPSAAWRETEHFISEIDPAHHS